jgi:hypothetical protein
VAVLDHGDLATLAALGWQPGPDGRLARTDGPVAD